jgi:2-dehydropantoate 2-reductase
VNVLVVGAGAVGQVYGRHLALGGAHVHYFVRARYADECRRGFAFYPLNRGKPRAAAVTMAVEPTDIVTTVDEVRAIKWDQVYICVASPALRGPWLAELASAFGDATVVALQPGQEDRDCILAAGVGADRLVSGMITVVSYHAPLPGESVPVPGMAYWFPPMAPAPFSGPAERTRAVVAALRQGKQPAKVGKDVSAQVRFPSALLMVLLTALEISGWSFTALARGPAIAQVRPAVLEAYRVLEAAYGARAPWRLKFLARAFCLRRVMTLARWIMPLPVETYFKAHFTKVGDQTRMFMQGYLAQGAKLGVPTPTLAALEAQITSRGSSGASAA